MPVGLQTVCQPLAPEQDSHVTYGRSGR